MLLTLTVATVARFFLKSRKNLRALLLEHQHERLGSLIPHTARAFVKVPLFVAALRLTSLIPFLLDFANGPQGCSHGRSWYIQQVKTSVPGTHITAPLPEELPTVDRPTGTGTLKAANA